MRLSYSRTPCIRGARLILALVLVVAMALVTGVPLASAGWGAGLTTTRVSVNSAGEKPAARGSKSPAISEDGRYVVFTSGNPLSAGDTNGYNDWFRHDMVSGETTLVSAASDGTQGNAHSGDEYVGIPSISADGRYVAFGSFADNLVPDDDTDKDDDGKRDVFVRDMVSGETTRVSGGSYGDVTHSGARDPSIDDSGTVVAFGTKKDLVPEDDNGYKDIFVRYLQSGETTRVSVASDGTQANDDSWYPAVSGNGRYVAFQSYASNLVAGDTNGDDDVFVHDLQTRTTIRVSVASDGAQGNSWSTNPRMSDDGRYVVFDSKASNLDPDDNDGTGDGSRDVFIHDMQTGTTTLISKAREGGLEQRGSGGPDISGDGRLVAFRSGLDLVRDDMNYETDIYVYDTATDTFRCASRAHMTGEILEDGSGYDCSPRISDVWTVAFDSWTPGLVPEDSETSDGSRDVFVRELRQDAVGVTRTAGADRYATAVEVSKDTFPSGADTVVIATGANWPDALCGSGLAGAVSGPVLLTRQGSLPASIKAEIERLGAENAYILGGTGAVSMAVENELDAMLDGTINRLAGANRYETGDLIAEKTTDILQWRWDGTILVATGGNFADALAGAPLASGLGWPIVLASPTSGKVTVPRWTSEAIILGGIGAVPMSTEYMLRWSELSNDDVMRIAGATRYDTAAMTAQYGVDMGLLWNGVGVATGQDFPDGLTGGAALGMRRAALLLTPSTSLAPAAEKKLEDNKDAVDSVVILGGTGAVSATVESSIKSALGL